MEDRGYYYVVDYRPDHLKPKPKRDKIWKFSITELKQLTVSVAVITLIFARIFGAFEAIADKDYIDAVAIFLGSFFATLTGFVFHELAHKFTAQRYGLWAEFRYDLNMLMFAMVLALVMGFAFIAPGAVMISGYYITREQNGKISVNGPLTNFMVASLALCFIMIGVSGIIGTVLYYVFYINVFLGLFNLLPFGPLDGKKVFEWNKELWASCILLGIGLIISHYLLT